MARIYDLENDEDYYDTLRIRPEGWVDDLVFDTSRIHRCGQAEAGIGISLSSERGGGVLTLDDLISLNKMITNHLHKVAESLGEKDDF